jgi:hypothetical protein
MHPVNTCSGWHAVAAAAATIVFVVAISLFRSHDLAQQQ